MEFANILVLNKTDLVSSEELERLRGILRKLNPEAKMLESQCLRRKSTFSTFSGPKSPKIQAFRMSLSPFGWLKVVEEERFRAEVRFRGP